MVVGRNKITFYSSQDWEELGYEKKKEWNAQIYSMKCCVMQQWVLRCLRKYDCAFHVRAVHSLVQG